MADLEEILSRRFVRPATPAAPPASQAAPGFTLQDASELKAVLDSTGATVLGLSSDAIGRVVTHPDSPEAVALINGPLARIVAARLVVAAMFESQPFGFAARVALDLLDAVEENVIGAIITDVASTVQPPEENIEVKQRFLSNAIASLLAVAEMADEVARAPLQRSAVAALSQMIFSGGDIARGYPAISAFSIPAIAATRSTAILHEHVSPLLLMMPVGGKTIEELAQFFLRAVTRSLKGRVASSVATQTSSKEGILALARSVVVASRRTAGLPAASKELFVLSRSARNAWVLMEASNKLPEIDAAVRVLEHEIVTDQIGTNAATLFVARFLKKSASDPTFTREAGIFVSNSTIAAKNGLFTRPIAFFNGFTTRRGFEDMAAFLARTDPGKRALADKLVMTILAKARSTQAGWRYAARYAELLRATEAFVIGKGLRLSRLSEIAGSAQRAEAFIERELTPMLQAAPEIPVDRAIETALIAPAADVVLASSAAFDDAARVLAGRQEIVRRMGASYRQWNSEVAKLVDALNAGRVGKADVVAAGLALDNIAVSMRRDLEVVRAATKDPKELSAFVQFENTIMRRVELITRNVRGKVAQQVSSGKLPFDLRVSAVGVGLFLGGLATSNEALAEVENNPSTGDFLMQFARTSKLGAEMSIRFFGPEVFGDAQAVEEVARASDAVEVASSGVAAARELGVRSEVLVALRRSRTALADLQSVVEKHVAAEALNASGVEWATYLVRLAAADIRATEQELAAAPTPKVTLSPEQERARVQLTQRLTVPETLAPESTQR